jgi:hypothetical protein
MAEDIKIETYMQKLEKIIPYWIKHNNEHLVEHQKWMEDARSLGLLEIAEEFESVTGLMKEANKHIDSIKEKIGK